MKTAIISGASAGLGLEFVRQFEENFPDINEVWLISRNEVTLRSAAELLKRSKAKIIALDLCREESFDTIANIFAEQKPDIRLLVNNAGCGFLGNIGETELRSQTAMVDLNVRALTALTALSVPYMSRGARIINVSSIAAFCSNPRMTVYSASKSYVSSFSLGLAEELAPRGITVTAVCSGPMATEFLDKAGISGRSKTFDMLPFCVPQNVVRGAYRASLADKRVHTPRAFFKFYRLVAKILPQRLMVKFTKA